MKVIKKEIKAYKAISKDRKKLTSKVFGVNDDELTYAYDLLKTCEKINSEKKLI